MKGLTPVQLVEITEFIQKHHSFGYVREENQIKGNLGYSIKYIDATYDSRQGDYWAISFRGFGKIVFTTNAYGFGERPEGFTYDNLYDWIMAFLNYDWSPENDKRFDFMAGDKEGPLHNSFPNGEIERPWSDFDMVEAYCADLKDRDSNDTLDACKWIIEYRNKVQRKSPGLLEEIMKAHSK